MVIENVKHLLQCCSQNLYMGTARIKQDKDTDEGKQKTVNMEKGEIQTNKSPKGLG